MSHTSRGRRFALEPALRRALQYPLRLLMVFSWEKSFRQNPVIGSLILNTAGLHLLRVVTAESRFRFPLRSPLVPAPDRHRFLAEGILVIRNFLPAAEFAGLRDELVAYRGPIRELREGATRTQRVFLDGATLSGLAACRLHRCGDASEPSSPLTLWMQARDNPFNPLFTPLPRLSAGIVNALWGYWLRHSDHGRVREGPLERVNGSF